VMKRMFKHYVQIAYIDMGYEDQEKYREFSRRAAKKINLDYQEIQGTTKLLEKMVNGPWDSGFVVVPPGHAVSFNDFEII
ncbi:MAG: DUF1638 domain-containing protein, partial [Desulfatiglandales bacterium]|nr:DUF1638 domain-containing protein [Desulfatiglandales bacterium]